MVDIKKLRSVINDASQPPKAIISEMLEGLPDESIFQHKDSLHYLQSYMDHTLDSNELSEGLRDLFKQSKTALGTLSSNATTSLNKTLRRMSGSFSPSMTKHMQKQVKEITKKLKDKYYFDYNLTVQSANEQRTLYSREFFNDLISSFGLSPDVEEKLLKEFTPAIRVFLKETREKYNKYLSNTPKAIPSPKQRNIFHYLPQSIQSKIEIDANELVGGIIGFAAAVSIAVYFRDNPARIEQGNGKVNESIDVNNILRTNYIDNTTDVIIEYSEDEHLKFLEEIEFDFNDDEFSWDDNIEESHSSIYDTYMKGK